MKLYAEIVFPLPLKKTFLYCVPERLVEKTEIGSRVLTSFHNRLLTGFIVRLKKRKPPDVKTIKEIDDVLDDTPVFTPGFLSFTQRLSSDSHTSWGEILQASLPPSLILKSKPRVSITEQGRAALAGKKVSCDERKILDFLCNKSYSFRFLQRQGGLKNLSSLLSGLEKREMIRIVKDIHFSERRAVQVHSTQPTQLEMDFSLDEKLNQTAQLMSSRLGRNEFHSFLLFGPDGKRESVYFALLRKNVGLKKTALFLVPEISLTGTVRKRFISTFGQGVAVLHSRMTDSQREMEWRRIRKGNVHLVVGPRSALFSPLENLGLIIVDEEHDESYYQKESPVYDARKGALIRGQKETAVVVFGSSIPTVEEFYRFERQGRLISLDSEAPRYQVVLTGIPPAGQKIDSVILRRIEHRLNRKEQVLVFFNRRGYAPFLICSRCGSIPHCRRCDISLAYHKQEEKLVCHYCNGSMDRLEKCPSCAGKMVLGKSYGAEAVEEELRKTFPRANIRAFNPDAVKGKGDQDRAVDLFSEAKIDLLVGTQLLAHRRDLPRVPAVAVLHPETALSFSDFRAGQRAFGRLSQMAGFLEKKETSELLIQTSGSPHFSIRSAAKGDFITFFRQEIQYRRLMKYPPFGCVVEVLFTGDDLRTLARNSRIFLASLQGLSDQVEVLGPARASVSKLRGQNRIQVVLKARRRKAIDDVLDDFLSLIKTRKSVFVYE
jgi:primosomal protein N' (replication factor Y)